MSTDSDEQKIFCIGFHRTGTTTFQTALEEMGFSAIGMRAMDWDAYEQKNFDSLRKSVSQYDAFRDMPWPLLYEWLDKEYPSALFVLTHRPVKAWVESCAGNYKHRPYKMFPLIYGFDVFCGNEKKAREVYLQHLDNVRNYFANRPGKLLDVDFTSEQSWDRLCEFLKQPVPERNFPHANNRPKSLKDKLRYQIMMKISPSLYQLMVRDK